MTMRSGVAAGCCLLMAGVLALGGSAKAQTGMGAGNAVVAPAASFDGMMKGFEDEMMGLAKAMPAEKYGFAPSSGIFKETQTTEYAGVRSFGQMVAHIAQANYYYYGRVGGMKPTVDVKAIGSMTGKDDLIAALAASFAFAHQAIATLTPANAFEKTPGPGMDTRASLAGGGVAHGSTIMGNLRSTCE